MNSRFTSLLAVIMALASATHALAEEITYNGANCADVGLGGAILLASAISLGLFLMKSRY